jgi:hypothetical protein
MTTNNTAEPPLANDAYWSVGDGGQWKSDNQYPVYVLPGMAGNTLIAATANYSGDIADVPHSQELLETQDPSDYVRLYVDVDTGASGSQYSGMFIYMSLRQLGHADRIARGGSLASKGGCSLATLVSFCQILRCHI